MKDFKNRVEPVEVLNKKQIFSQLVIDHGPTVQELFESVDSLRVELAESGVAPKDVGLQIARTPEAPRQLIARITREETDEEFGRRKAKYEKDDAAYKAWRKEHKKDVEAYEKDQRDKAYDELEEQRQTLLYKVQLVEEAQNLL